MRRPSTLISTASQVSLWWLEQESKQRKIHIHHAMCGHGGRGTLRGFMWPGATQKTIKDLFKIRTILHGVC